MTCFERLDLPPTTTPLELKARWRTLAAKHHPDRGGNAEVFHQLRQAYEEASKLVERCPTCRGNGQAVAENSFIYLKLRCTSCDGTGKRR